MKRTLAYAITILTILSFTTPLATAKETPEVTAPLILTGDTPSPEEFNQLDYDFDFTVEVPANDDPTEPDNADPTAQQSDQDLRHKVPNSYPSEQSARANLTTKAGVVPVRCKGSLDTPHHSHHVPGTVNSQARITCQVPLPEIDGFVRLIRDNKTSKTSTGPRVLHKKSWKENVSMRCDGKKHHYKASTYINWIAPFGARLQTGTASYIKQAYVVC